MRRMMVILGQTKLVILITIVSVILAVSINILLGFILGHSNITSDSIIRSIIIPLIIAPFISWYLIGMFFELDRLESKMAYLANYDDLTGLLRRSAFYDSANLLHKNISSNHNVYSVIYADLDHFKKINDEYGHAAGDWILKSFGAISKDLTRKGDILGRIGGEEFAVVMPNTSKEEAFNFSERLRQKIQTETIHYDNMDINYTVSIGVSSLTLGSDKTFNDVLKRADDALYIAKRNGRDQISVI